jgi:squalene-hopene/tetraprenyl-beta-curcumene cyclase
MKAGSRRSFLGQAIPAAGLLGLSLRSAHGQVDSSATAAELENKAVNFLRPRQGDDGSWSGDRKEPGITGLVVTALLRSGRVTADDMVVTKALGYLERFLGPKGGLSEAPHSVYATSVAIMAFQVANKSGRYDRVIKGGQGFLKSTQWDETEKKGRVTDFYGGAGYGGQNSRPDLSNTTFMMEAVRNTGLPADDPALQKGSGVRVAMSEPQERIQRPIMGRQGQRRWLHLYGC